MLVEVTNSGIAWAEPTDLPLDKLVAAEVTSSAQLASNHGRREEFFFTCDHDFGVNVAMADGSVRFLWLGNRSPEDLRKLFQIGGLKDEELGEPARHLNWPNIAALIVWLISVGTLLVGAVRSRKPAGVVCPSVRQQNCTS
jgi:prepilin-type processing-associated H-X9-DG protein